MHQYAEYGVAAHWAYKEGRKSAKESDKKFTFLRQLMDWEREVTDPHQFAESLKTDIFKDQVYVFTPKGDVFELPEGATPIDFAYAIHTDIGHKATSARINDIIANLDTELRSGDICEIIVDKNRKGPNPDWIKHAVTNQAKNKIKPITPMIKFFMYGLVIIIRGIILY